MTDRDLLMAILNSQPSPKQVEFFGEQLAMVELGLVENLLPSVKRHAEAVARAKGILPPHDPKKDRARKIRAQADDMYSDKLTPGAAFAEQLVEKYRKRIHSGLMLKLGVAEKAEKKGAA